MNFVGENELFDRHATLRAQSSDALFTMAGVGERIGEQRKAGTLGEGRDRVAEAAPALVAPCDDDATGGEDDRPCRGAGLGRGSRNPRSPVRTAR